MLGLTPGSDLLPVLSEPLMWKHLRTLAIGLTLNTRSDFDNITRFLTEFQPSCLEDAALHARTSNKDVVYAAYHDDLTSIDAGVCMQLQGALLKFRRSQLSFLVSLKGGARKHLWTRELGELFPTLRDLNRLTIKCESSERPDPRISSI